MAKSGSRKGGSRTSPTADRASLLPPVDRDFWRAVIERRYLMPDGHSLADLTFELLGYLASSDPELRDTFAYGILARWITLYTYYKPDELRQMIEWLTPALAEGLGEVETDSIFLRAYAALILSLIVYRDNRAAFLSAVETRALLDKARHYLLAERDTRAYVPEKGWANACGHTADWLKFLARSGHLESPDLLRLLDTTADRLLMDSVEVFTHDEDERLAQVVVAVVRRGTLTTYELTSWLRRFKDWKTAQNIGHASYSPTIHAIYQNVRNFLRSLYCQMRLASRLPVETDEFEIEVLDAVRMFSL